MLLIRQSAFPLHAQRLSPYPGLSRLMKETPKYLDDLFVLQFQERHPLIPARNKRWG